MSTDIYQPVFTVGHSNLEFEKFVALLKQHDIQAVADVRSSPYSQYNPQFNREILHRALREQGITYVFLGVELGARRSESECYINGRIGKRPAFALHPASSNFGETRRRGKQVTRLRSEASAQQAGDTIANQSGVQTNFAGSRVLWVKELNE